MTSKKTFQEVDLYPPVEAYFQALGYNVHGEVKNCDVTATKQDELIIIELKKAMSIDLLVQVANRQRLTDLVYVAIPKPKYKRNSKKWRDLCLLLKRLELGFIIVTFLASGPKVEVVFTPEPFNRKRSQQYYQAHRKKLLEEINGRNAGYNMGGSHKTKIMTAYKECCIHIASLLNDQGPLRPKELRALGTSDKTLSILHKNYYGWYEKVGHGLYQISTLGKKELLTYSDIVEHYKHADKTTENS